MDLRPLIDHSVLWPTATPADVDRACDVVERYQVHGICVNPRWVRRAADRLRDRFAVVAVVGFPLGAIHTASKVDETRRATGDGATEIDMVLPLGELRARERRRVEEDVGAVVDVAHPAPVKAIIEAGLLESTEEKVLACRLAVAAGAAFVKTSTGFAWREADGQRVLAGATVADVAIMRQAVGQGIGVKAAGGIRTLRAAEAMVAAGANRIGTSATAAILGGQGPRP